MKELTEVKNKIAWFEKEEKNLTNSQKDNITHELKNIDGTLRRMMLVCLAVNKK